ncbi:hypothetical protein XELAEV_18045603mg [Xenopus laevis]|uniref:Uncharacterized protein n=1 Tax=Xenopus laevis TaxID=8355 RepID=A0A974H4F4_XENLA|nr:hypothetical protein XELAEV_18045603mg [Xenopus laevis]
MKINNSNGTMQRISSIKICQKCRLYCGILECPGFAKHCPSCTCGSNISTPPAHVAPTYQLLLHMWLQHINCSCTCGSNISTPPAHVAPTY